MKVQLIRKNGGPEVLEASEIDRPSPSANQVLVKIAAASVNSADLMTRSMGPVVDFIPTPPAVLGMDFSGTIEALGDGVEEFAVGDAVYGNAGGVAQHQGTLAEYIAADVQLLARKPQCLTMIEAAALPLVSITAYEALFDRLDVKSGHTVLIHGGAGGVGHIAVQLAVQAGAKVFSTGSGSDSLETISKLGATPIDYKKTSVEEYVGQYTGGAGFDKIFDTVGGPNLPNSFTAAKLNGQVATTVTIGEIDMTQAHLRGVTLHVIYMLIPLIHGEGGKRHHEILSEVAKLSEAGKVRPLIDSTFPLEKALEAHRKLESKTTIGKVVVEVSS